MKKIISSILTVIMCMSMVVGVYAAPVEYGQEYENQPNLSYEQSFSDVDKSYWAFEYIAEMANRGVISGYPNGYFYPENNVTRAEFAKIMSVAAGLVITPNVSATTYTDVTSADWFAPYVEAARYYLNGYKSNGELYYLPNEKALREDIAVALVKLKGYDTSLYDESILKAMFTDWQSISEGARKYVAIAVEQSLISGYEDNTFRGQNSITRAEAATLLWRTYQYGNGNKVFEKEELDKATLNKQTSKTLKILTNTPFEPFEYYKNNSLVGFDIELMKVLCEEIGYIPIFEDVEFDAIMVNVCTGKADCAIAGISVTPEREQVVDFSNTYISCYVDFEDEKDVEQEYAIAFPKGSPLISDFNFAIAKAKEDGTIDSLIKKYNIEEKEIVNNKAENVDKKLKLSLNTDKTSYSIEENEDLSFTVKIGYNILLPLYDIDGNEIERKGYPLYFDDEKNIIKDWLSNIKLTDEYCSYKITTKKLKEGKYTLRFYVTDDYTTHEELITINVTKSEPEYFYEVTTVINNVDEMDMMIGDGKGSVYYAVGTTMYDYINTDDAKIYKVSEKGNKKEVYSSKTVPILLDKADEMTKEEKSNIGTKLISFGYNQNDDCLYVLIRQKDTYYFYNLDAKEVLHKYHVWGDFTYEPIRLFDNIGSCYHGSPMRCNMAFDNNGNIYIGGMFVNKSIEGMNAGFYNRVENSDSDSNSYFINNKLYMLNGRHLQYADIRSNTLKDVDYYIPSSEACFGLSDEYLYVVDYYNTVHQVDITTGDSTPKFCFDDIDICDGKTLKLSDINSKKATLDDDESIYFWDVNYSCIRKISKK